MQTLTYYYCLLAKIFFERHCVIIIIIQSVKKFFTLSRKKGSNADWNVLQSSGGKVWSETLYYSVRIERILNNQLRQSSRKPYKTNNNNERKQLHEYDHRAIAISSRFRDLWPPN